MAAIATLSLADGAASPVTRTFSPIGVKNAVAKWQDKSGGVSLGFPTITVSLREPTKVSRTNKVTAKVVFPTLDTTLPTAIKKAHECLINIDVVLPENASPLDRAHVLAFGKNFIASAVFTDMVKDLTNVW